MRWLAANWNIGVPAIMVGSALAVCAWQHAEHARFQRTAAAALVNRGRDITSTLGVVVRSQRRAGGLVSHDRIVAALQDLIHPGQLESVAILGATGETIASAGKPLDLSPERLRNSGIHWGWGTLTLFNLMDLGTTLPVESGRAPATIVVADPRAFRASTRKSGAAATYGRPAWMSREDYDAVIEKQGVHSLVIALATTEMERAVRHDLWLRSLVSLLAVAAALGAALAWRKLRQNADLQIRLVKAGEMNTHLAAMNLAAAGLAHETRNPLNLIRGRAQMIAMQTQEAPGLNQHAAAIVEETDRVTVQLNEFIQFSKPREPHPAPVDLTSLVMDVARALQPDLEEKGITFHPPATAVTVLADELLLRQALFNLLLNAAQAVAPGGEVAVRTSVTAPHQVCVDVCDDGPGVPVADRLAIFKPYVTMRAKGAGLGLAIVQQIVTAHQWEISCEDNHPCGAIFRIRHITTPSPSGGLVP